MLVKILIITFDQPHKLLLEGDDRLQNKKTTHVYTWRPNLQNLFIHIFTW